MNYNHTLFSSWPYAYSKFETQADMKNDEKIYIYILKTVVGNKENSDLISVE